VNSFSVYNAYNPYFSCLNRALGSNELSYRQVSLSNLVVV